MAHPVYGSQRHIAATLNGHSSFRSSRSAPTRRTIDASLEKMPPTLVLRLISQFNLSIGLVEWSLARWIAGKSMKARTSSSAWTMKAASL